MQELKPNLTPEPTQDMECNDVTGGKDYANWLVISLFT
jgi:hypothetical protein